MAQRCVISCKLWYFYDVRSDGTHSLQRIHWWASDVMLNFSKSVPMNEWCIYIALFVYCCTPKALYNHGGGGVSPQPPPVCSIHLDDATAATGQQRQCAHHTPATGEEQRESTSQSSAWGLLGDHDWQGPVEGIWSGHRGYTLLLTRSAMGFLITTESHEETNSATSRMTWNVSANLHFWVNCSSNILI